MTIRTRMPNLIAYQGGASVAAPLWEMKILTRPTVRSFSLILTLDHS